LYGFLWEVAEILPIILLFSFISSSMLLYQIIKFTASKQKTIYRLRKYIAIEEIREEKKNTKKDLKKGLNIITRGIGSIRFLGGYKKNVQFRLNRAHVLLKAEEYMTICLILFALLSLLVFLISSSVIISVITGFIGMFIPKYILGVKIKKRVKYLNDQLSDAITLISNSLKAGYSFFQSVDIVTKEMTGPISEEFLLLQKEINLGLPTEEALENLIGRVGSDDLELVVTAVIIQRQTGGNLSEVLDNISSTIRDRVKIKAEVRTITAQGRMSGLIISILPIVLGFIIYLINPEHISILFKSPLGLGILGFSVIMELIGIFAISKIVKVEV
jgi:tight adherence protein B